MYETPVKTQHTLQQDYPQSSLKSAISQKIGESTRKQKLYSTNHKNALTTESKTKHIDHRELQIMELVSRHESRNNKGYFQYDDWLDFNAICFRWVREDTARELWKILRVINYGEVLIPSGLIFQLTIWLTVGWKKDQKKQEGIKSILNDFLKSNMVKDCVNTFRELSHYKDLQIIEQEYCLGESENIDQLEFTRKKNQPNKIPFFQRALKEARNLQQKRIKMKYNSIAEQTKECTFTPAITRYNSKNKIKKCDRVCYHKEQFNVKNRQMKQEEAFVSQIFIAKGVDPEIYEERVELISGVTEHINRRKYCEFQKQRLKRFLNRPT